jgi:uncharacterized protein YjiS (DUF1127 family)
MVDHQIAEETRMYVNLISMFQRSRSRAAAVGRLAELDDRMLADIGLTRGDLPRIRARGFGPGARTHE